MPRDWSQFRTKVEAEGHCRVGGKLCGPPEAAHIIQRSRVPGPEAEDPLNCVPLCRDHHAAYDALRLNMLPYLSPAEQAYAVMLAGGIVAAYNRLMDHSGGQVRLF